MSLFTSLPPGVHRVGMGTSLAPTVPTLAERLQDAGFVTEGTCTANYWLGEGFGFGRGFGRWDILALGQDAGRQAGARLAAALGDAGPDTPWFTFVHYMDVHSLPTSARFPYRPHGRDWWRVTPAEAAAVGKHVRPLPASDPFHGKGVQAWDLERYDVEFLRGSYDDCIRYWDGVRLPALLRSLRREGLLDDTLIVVTADHGEEFAEHGRYGHKSPHREVREVPLIMVWPGRIAAGAVVRQRVTIMDLAPTILDLAGLPPLPDAQGASLRPLLRDPDAVLPDRDFFIDGDHRGLRQEPGALLARHEGTWWMLKARCDTTGTAGGYRPATVSVVEGLYDLDNDPGETRDLRAERPDVLAALRARLTLRLQEEAALAARLLGGAGERDGVELSDEQKRGLKALGY
jgi:arylsulfatase A-like enzyme